MARARNNSNLLSALAVMLALLAAATHAQQDIVNPAVLLVDTAAGAAEQPLLVVPETADVAAVPSAAAAAAIRPEVAATTGTQAVMGFRHVLSVPCMGCGAVQPRPGPPAWPGHMHAIMCTICIILQLHLPSIAVWCLCTGAHASLSGLPDRQPGRMYVYFVCPPQSFSGGRPGAQQQQR